MNATKIKTGVCVIITDADQKILLGKRQNVLGENTWGLPGGHQKLGESIFECAKREVFAEVNIELEAMELVDVSEIVDTGLDYQLVELGYASTKWQGILQLKEHKYCSEWKFFDINELPADIYLPHKPIVERMVSRLKKEDTKQENNLYNYIHPHFKIGVQDFVINKKGQLLMGLRKDPYDKGNWGLPGGHLDVGETLEECAIRELEEESGIIATHALQFAYVEQPITLSNKHYLHFGYLIKDFDESIPLINGEPDDVDHWEWFDLNNMPHNLAPTQREMILKFLKLNKISFARN
ncbi:MAG: NUDIX domain-containing protein [Candidatus Abawacabacteria bacterium]|nr:NUDIX domain-containing protein [Candidatus Abawacabacteria bacterium]